MCIIHSFLDSILDKRKTPIVSQQNVYDLMSVCYSAEEAMNSGENIKINPYDNLPLSRKLIDKKNKQVGFFDLGNHILIIGMVLLVIFISLNVD